MNEFNEFYFVPWIKGVFVIWKLLGKAKCYFVNSNVINQIIIV